MIESRSLFEFAKNWQPVNRLITGKKVFYRLIKIAEQSHMMWSIKICRRENPHLPIGYDYGRCVSYLAQYMYSQLGVIERNDKITI